MCVVVGCGGCVVLLGCVGVVVGPQLGGGGVVVVVMFANVWTWTCDGHVMFLGGID